MFSFGYNEDKTSKAGFKQVWREVTNMHTKFISVSYLNNYKYDNVAMAVTLKFILGEINVASICTVRIVQINV
jgi:hypothetical protein